jgi:excisionase family DNA binding protein
MTLKVYTVEELVPILRMKKRAIRRCLAEGELSGQLVGKKWLVTEEAVKVFLNAPDLTSNGSRSTSGK